ncbi:uncharacterized protein LOC125785804 isoform X2 [Astyanax mexicanus]|uniref:uncharacterized protein LOC125785804 isoform X2 n=1 Tax=Astyanax mexicanus TaxID=7994 RepID=UPI0020CAD142|nr:uncharacterized protein LOC125785804 isoform X2 [Astyanax mexicanus]
MGRSAQSCEVMVMVMVVVMLVCGWTDGKVVSKCDLRSRLQKAFLRHPSDVIAKMVCTVEYISVFNTGLVTTNNNGPLGSFIGPQYNKGYNYPIPEVIGDYFPENWPGTAEPENPSFPPEVVSDDLIPARPSQKPAVTSVQSGEEQGSGDEPPSGNGSGKGSKSQTGGKHGVDSGEESGEDGSGERLGEDSIPLLGSTNQEIIYDSYEDVFGHKQREDFGEPLEATTAIPLLGSTNEDIHYDSYEDLFGHKQREGSGESSKSKSKGKHEADSGEESGEDGSGYHFSGEGSGSSGEPLEATTAIPLLGITNQEIIYDSYEDLFGHKQREDSGESSKSKSKGKGEADSGEESGEDGSGYHFSEEGSGSSGEPLEPTTAIPEGDSTNNDFFPGDTDEIPAWQRKYPYEPRNNEDIHYDSYETIYGHPQKKDPNMPNNHEGRPYTYYNHGNPYNGNHQDSSPRNLYGIFQLSDNMACQSQGRHSLNACSLYCEDLIDSDITDDIDCLMTLKNLGMDVMVLEQCQTIGASEYFAECD